MKKCDLMVDLGRRRFLSGAGFAAAGAAATTIVSAPAQAKPAAALVEYPANKCEIACNVGPVGGGYRFEG